MTTSAQRAHIYRFDEAKPTDADGINPAPGLIIADGIPRRVWFKDGSSVILEIGEAVYCDDMDRYML